MSRHRKATRTRAAAKSQDLQGFLAEFQNESDRAAAILSAALLDEWLRRLLVSFLIDVPKEVDAMLDVEQPIGSFGARIRLAYCLGLLDEKLFRLLTLIKKVRNEFAHQLHGLTFETAEVAETCATLRRELDLPVGLPEAPRFAFMSATFSAQLSLWGYTTSMEVSDRRRKVPQWTTLVDWKGKT
jgi:DNA-binding MltR family transcriptional regulator